MARIYYGMPYMDNYAFDANVHVCLTMVCFTLRPSKCSRNGLSLLNFFKRPRAHVAMYLVLKRVPIWVI